ncbi:hypothetical protein QUA54_30625 [Microcoleus sp. MOSTC5]|uniref:hypothetical protein n=1 Tax=Microcoleus sp. MOSTC5 TaxID=3055378 RepID=UPI002FCFCD48
MRFTVGFAEIVLDISSQLKLTLAMRQGIHSLAGLRTIAHFPVLIELYRLRVFLEDLTAEGAEEEMRGMDNSDLKGFDLSGKFNFIYNSGRSATKEIGFFTLSAGCNEIFS